MPIYEYRREDGTTFEVMHKFSDPPITVDPETGQPVTRVYSPVAVQAVTTALSAPDAGAPGAPAAGSGGVTDVDALVGKLYDPLVRRLKAELRLDRERAGHVLDLRQ